MMRGIVSKEKEAKKQKRNQIILGIILVFIMFFSVAGYAFRGGDADENKKVSYNGFDFLQKNGFWYSEINGKSFVFRNNPEETDVEVKINSVPDYSGKPLYLFSENSMASSEITGNLGKIAERIQQACLNKEECNGNFPVKTCGDNFIIIKKNNESKITQNDSCIFIYSSDEELAKTADEFLFKVLGVK
jgi:hypothetical protein